MSHDPDDDFDFERECIRAFRDAGDDLEKRIKVLSLLKNVHLAKAAVKPPEGDPLARKIQDKLNR